MAITAIKSRISRERRGKQKEEKRKKGVTTIDQRRLGEESILLIIDIMKETLKAVNHARHMMLLHGILCIFKSGH